MRNHGSRAGTRAQAARKVLDPAAARHRRETPRRRKKLAGGRRASTRSSMSSWSSASPATAHLRFLPLAATAAAMPAARS
uniref:Uncharacterized protein n=1 Tax=Arundo donax TaxID=35708 RepID=A0A0A9C469_ARUDO